VKALDAAIGFHANVIHIRKRAGGRRVGGRGKGVGALEAAWSLALEAELAEAEGLHVAGVFLDCTKCYDRLPLCELLGCARAEDFPLAIAQLAVDMYRGRRYVRVAGRCLREFLCFF
jgi:hypothetical protein